MINGLFYISKTTTESGRKGSASPFILRIKDTRIPASLLAMVRDILSLGRALLYL
jgi:hypothetical protein